MPRLLAEQFEPEQAQRVEQLIAALNSLRPRFAGGAAQYYLAEIGRCLNAGLLFGGLCVSLALLELFARDLVIALRARHVVADDLQREVDRIERELEDATPRMYFKKLLTILAENGIAVEPEGQVVTEIYAKVRNPLYHGLTRRFVHERYLAQPDAQFLYSANQGDRLAPLLAGRDTRFYQLEELIEKQALGNIEAIAHFIRAALEASGSNTIP